MPRKGYGRSRKAKPVGPGFYVCKSLTEGNDMKNPQFVNLYFADSPDTAYYKEMSDFQSPYDCINMLTQAYVRVLNNLKKGWLFREDVEFTNLLQGFTHEVMTVYFKTLDTEKVYSPLFEETVTFLDI